MPLDTLHTVVREALARPEAPGAHSRLRDDDPSALSTLAPDRLTLASTWLAATQAVTPVPGPALAGALGRDTREHCIAEGLVREAARA